jgi:hypothetical protein
VGTTPSSSTEPSKGMHNENRIALASVRIDQLDVIFAGRKRLRQRARRGGCFRARRVVIGWR